MQQDSAADNRRPYTRATLIFHSSWKRSSSNLFLPILTNLREAKFTEIQTFMSLVFQKCQCQQRIKHDFAHQITCSPPRFTKSEHDVGRASGSHPVQPSAQSQANVDQVQGLLQLTLEKSSPRMEISQPHQISAPILECPLGGGSFCISNWNFPCLNSCQNISHRIASFIPPLDQSISSEVHKNLLSHAWIKYTSCITEELHKPQASQHGSCRVVRPTRTIAKLLFQNGTGLFCHQ